MRANGRQRFVCPGISNPQVTPKQHEKPTYSFQLIFTDLFHMPGRLCILYGDRFSVWTEVALTNANSNAKIIWAILRLYFMNFGVSKELSSDGG